MRIIEGRQKLDLMTRMKTVSSISCATENHDCNKQGRHHVSSTEQIDSANPDYKFTEIKTEDILSNACPVLQSSLAIDCVRHHPKVHDSWSSLNWNASGELANAFCQKNSREPSAIWNNCKNKRKKNKLSKTDLWSHGNGS